MLGGLQRVVRTQLCKQSAAKQSTQGEWVCRELAALLRTKAEVVVQRMGSDAADGTTLTLTLEAEPIEVHPVQYAVLPRYVA